MAENSNLCCNCGTDSVVACLCERQPMFFCNNCYWPHIQQVGRGTHRTLQIDIARNLTTQEKVNEYLKYADELPIIHSVVQNMINYLDEYQREVKSKGLQSINRIKNIMSREEQKVDNLKFMLNDAQNEVLRHIAVIERSVLAQELLEVLQHSGSEYLEDRLFHLFKTDLNFEQTDDSVNFHARLKEQEFIEIMNDPSVLSEEPTIPMDQFDQTDPGGALKFYLPLPEPFQAVAEPMYLYQTIPFDNKVVALNCALQTCSVLTIQNIKEFPRWPGCCLVGEQKMFLCGGQNKERQPQRNVVLLDFTSRESSPIVPMHEKRCSPAVVNHQCSIYVFGGRKSFSFWIQEVEMFNRETNVWIKLCSLAKAPSFIKAVVNGSNEILILGTGTQQTCMYNPERDTYQTTQIPIKLSKEQFIPGIMGDSMYLIQKNKMTRIDLNSGKFTSNGLQYRFICKSQLGLFKMQDSLYFLAERPDNMPVAHKIALDDHFSMHEINYTNQDLL